MADQERITPSTYIKFTTDYGRPRYGRGTYRLPTNGKPAEWMPQVPYLVLCQSGYHVTTPSNFERWADARMYVVDTAGQALHTMDKSCFQDMRFRRRVLTWNRRTAVLLGFEIADKALELLQEPSDCDDTCIAERAEFIKRAKRHMDALRRSMNERGRYSRMRYPQMLRPQIDDDEVLYEVKRIVEHACIAARRMPQYRYYEVWLSGLTCAAAALYLLPSLMYAEQWKKSRVRQTLDAWVAERLCAYLNGEA